MKRSHTPKHFHSHLTREGRYALDDASDLTLAEKVALQHGYRRAPARGLVPSGTGYMVNCVPEQSEEIRLISGRGKPECQEGREQTQTGRNRRDQHEKRKSGNDGKDSNIHLAQQAIWDSCLECSGHSTAQVRRCHIRHCPLFRFRGKTAVNTSLAETSPAGGIGRVRLQVTD